MGTAGGAARFAFGDNGARKIFKGLQHFCFLLFAAPGIVMGKRGSTYPQLEGPRQSVGKRDTKERKNAIPRSPLKEFGAALGRGFCSECTIFTSQQTTFV